MVKPTKRHYLEWFSAAGDDPILFDSGGLPFVLESFNGFSSTLTSTSTTKSPNQIGKTHLNTRVSERSLSATVIVDALNYPEYWERRARLVESLVSVPSMGDEPPKEGVLRLFRPGHPMLQVQATPVNSPQESGRKGRYGIKFDIEWEAAQPFWEEISDRLVTFKGGGEGFTFPLAHPWSSEAFNVEQEFFNPGHMAVPFQARLYGEGTTARIINETTGQTIEVTGDIGPDDYVEVSTEFGGKRATLVAADGSRTNVMDRVNFDLTEFWLLAKGTNRVRFEMDNNVSGHADLRYRPRYGGV